MDDLNLSAGLLPEPRKPKRGGINRDRILEIARSDNIPDDIADDFTKVMNFESGGSHYDRRGKVKLSPPDPKTGERAVGLTQIKPSTAREVGVKDPFDENENLKAGLRYFAKGGSDPAGRRIHYFGGPRPLQRYQRTGRIPKGKDVLGTTFEKYVQQTGGQQKSPKIDLSAGLVDDLDVGLEDSGQNLPPKLKSDRVSQTPAPAKSVPKTFWGLVRARMDKAAKEPAPQPRPQVSGLGVPTKDELVDLMRSPGQPTFEQDIAMRASRTEALKQASKKGVKVNALRQQVAAEMSKPETYSDQFGTRQRMSKPDPDAVEAETLRRAQEQVPEIARKERVSKMGWGEYLAQVPKSSLVGVAQGVGTTAKALAVGGRKLVDQVTDTTGFDTQDAYLYQLGEAVQKEFPKLIRSNPDLEQEFWIGKAPAAIGQSLEMVLGGAAIKSPKLVVSALGGLMTAGDAYDQARSAGASDAEAVNWGLLAGAILGPTELYGTGMLRKALAGTVQGEILERGLKASLIAGTKDAWKNSIQELGQEYLQGKITGLPRSAQELLEAWALGGVAGGAVTTGTTAVRQTLGGRRGTQAEAQPDVAAQPETIEPAGRPQGVAVDTQRSAPTPEQTLPLDVVREAASAEQVSQRPVSGREQGDTDAAGVRPSEESAPQRFYHRDYGEVTESPDQRRVGKGRIRVVAEDGTPHVIKRSAMTGAGNQRAVPIKPESTSDLNLESGLESPAETMVPAKPEPRVASFKTAKGSTYTVSGRTTQRTKSLHEHHDPADVGLKEPSDRTVYVTPNAAEEIGLHGQLNREAHPRAQLTDDGIVIEYKYGKGPNGEPYYYTQRKVIPYTQIPEVGFAPVEFFQSGKYHAGNPIVEITRRSKSQSQPAETLPDISVEPPASSMAEGASAPFPPETSKLEVSPTEQVTPETQPKQALRLDESEESARVMVNRTNKGRANYKPESQSLSEAWRALGGERPNKGVEAGETRRLSQRESGIRGLLNNNSDRTAEDLGKILAEDGYRGDWVEVVQDPSGQYFRIDHQKLREAVLDDARGIKRSSTGEDFDWDAEMSKHYETEYGDVSTKFDSFLAEPNVENLFNKVVSDATLTEGELNEIRTAARKYGVEGELERTIERHGDTSFNVSELEAPQERTVSERGRTPTQLGFVPEGLEQQVATPQPSDIRGQLAREEQDRQAALNPARAAAQAKLEEIRRRGMTVDDYARQPDLFGNLPSQDEVAQLKALESGEQVSEPDQPEMFGPGTMRAGEPLPEVKEREFGKRFVEDERIAEEIRDIGTARYYEPVPNKITVAEAEKLVEKRGLAESITIIKDETNTVPAHIRSVMGQSVILKLNRAFQNLKESDRKAADRILDTSVDLAEWLMDYGTRLGQGVQAFAVWARLTPEGKLLTYKRGVRKARDRHKERHGEEVEEIISVVNKEGMTDAERLEALKNLFKSNKTAKKIKTDFERLLKAAKTGKLTDETFYDVVAERLGLPVYNQEIARKLTELAHKIEAAPEGLPRTKLVLELQKFIAEQKGFDVADLPLGVFYANILSGYNTHAVNFADTALNVLSEINGLAILEPRAASFIYSGMLRGFTEGRWDAMMALTEGRMFRDSKWLDAPGLMEIAKFGQKGGVPIKTETRTGRVAKRIAEMKIAVPLNAYKYVTRAMSAADAVNARAASEARSTLLAYRMAKAEGLKGDELESRVREILALDKQSDFLKQAEREGFTGREAEFRATELRDMMRPKDLSADAAEFAGEATYNHTPHGTLGLIADSIGNLSNRVKPLKLFVPFTRIVANVTNRGLNYTPYGYKRAVMGWGFGKNAEPLTAENRRLMLTRATLGTSGLLLLGVLQEAGVMAIHGNGPSDREKRRQMQNAGWRPYSLQIGDVYISYVYSPVGLGLSIIGNMKDATRYHELEQKDAATRGAYAVARLGSTIFSQSFLSGLSRLFGALSDEPSKSVTSVKQTLGGTVAAFAVPNLVRDVHRLFDNKAYQSTTLMEDLIRNTPFAALALKPTLNAFGEPVKLQRQRFVDKLTDDPAWRFVIQKGLRVPVPGRTIEMADGRRITPEEYYELLKSSGPKVKDWILQNRSRLSRMKEQDAQDALSEAATKIRKFELTRMKMKIRKKAA